MELAFVVQILTLAKDEPVAAFLAILVVIGGLIHETRKHIIPFVNNKIFKGEKKKTAEELLEALAREVKILSEAVADNEALMQSTSQGTLENMLFNEEQSPFRRIKAFIRLIAMRANGRVKKKGFEVVLAHKETYLDVLDTVKHLNLKIVDQEYFDGILAEISRRIFDGGI